MNEALIRQLHRGDFINGADNVVLIGGPGTGKTHMATALGVQAVEHHRKKVRFFSTVDLVNALEQEKAMNKAGQLAERLLRLDLVILDELGYLPFSPSGGALLFRRVRRCQDDHRAARSANPSLPHPRDRQRQLPLQSQLRCPQNTKGKSHLLTHYPHRGKHTSTRVTSQ